ncbi:hypothetical protein [Priestia megaterium]|uniref:Uncharacterized protein n=1 Tax=Priestia megaterium TaxID=1404 RepID=A0A6M6E481_PRIMG|nr:hypothetical protein [Priestia megaterium]QJX79979.1 hypothetical protein FDZ14_28155 [Priestia megaterium]
MMVRSNDKDYPILKDKIKRIVYWIFGLLFIAITLSLVVNFFTVNDKATPSNKNEVSTVTKETEKEVKGKIEKIKEVTKTEKPPQQAKGFQELMVHLLYKKTIGTVIVKHFLMYLGLMILYLLFLLTQKDVSNLKVAGLEVGTNQDVQAEFYRAVEEQKNKFDFLTFWMREENRLKFIRSTDIEHRTFLGFLSRMLEKMQEYYRDEWNINFSFTIYKMSEFEQSNLPRKVKNSAASLMEEDKGLPILKENNLYYHKNYLIYKVTEVNVRDATDIKEYMIVLSSYYSEFEEVDGILISGLSALINLIYIQTTQSDFIVYLLKENEGAGD